jgi:AcrR family transcriptional regulator
MAARLKQKKTEVRPRYGNKRPAVLDAALKLFAANGVGATTVPMIAATANVAIGTLYCHFPSKEALANHLVAESCQAFCKHLWDAFPHEVSFRQQFGVFWRRYLSFALERPEAYTFLYQRAKDLDLSEEGQKALQTLEETENWILDRGIAAGGLAPLPKAALSAILHGTAKALLQSHFDGTLKLDEFLVSQTEECCWVAVGGISSQQSSGASKQPHIRLDYIAKKDSGLPKGIDVKI